MVRRMADLIETLSLQGWKWLKKDENKQTIRRFHVHFSKRKVAVPEEVLEVDKAKVEAIKKGQYEWSN